MPLRRRHRHGSGKLLPQVAAFCKLSLIFPASSCGISGRTHLCQVAIKENGMRCPVDNETLVMADRGGVEIDYCPKCRGVWLDRGELDKIIERSFGATAPAPVMGPPPPPPSFRQTAPVYQPEPGAPQAFRDDDRRRDDRRDDRRRDDDDDDYRRGHKKKRRESFLSELFDF
jgi:uncharacterized protein